jgi:hypothetical protein
MMKKCLAFALVVAIVSAKKYEHSSSKKREGEDPIVFGLWGEKVVSFHALLYLCVVLTLTSVGDVPYTKIAGSSSTPIPPPRDDPVLMELVNDMNNFDLDFTVHMGDIKSGSTWCSDEKYDNFAELVNDILVPPTVLTLGDNGWTDCHRTNNNGYDPLERLQKMREMFFARWGKSLGKKPIKVEMQSQDYPENARWGRGPAYFITAHVVGSNNNKINEGQCLTSKSVRTLDDCVAANNEYAAREEAVIQWLQSSFADAQEKGYEGIMIFIQANPEFDVVITEDVNEAVRNASNDGLTRFIDTLYMLTKGFNGPVFLIHGDSHQFVFDKPFPIEGQTFEQDPAGAYQVTGASLDNFFRIEQPGADNYDWIMVEVDPTYRHLFRIAPMFGPHNAAPAVPHRLRGDGDL